MSRQPSSAAKQLVREAFDAAALVDLCSTWDFADYGLERMDLGAGRFYYYKDNGSDVLAIAHLDSVQSDTTCRVVDTAAGLLATSGALDDRLGVYVILSLLPALGITCDWLLTTDEEIGQSTADEFDTDKQYNWLIQFDRGGTDVVLYDYETTDLCALVAACGARVGQGSYSDICVLDHLGCAGFNWGVGYEDYHGPRSHAWLEDTFRMVARFVKFHRANAATFLGHKPTDRWPSKYDTYDYPDDDRKPEDLEYGDLVVANCGHLIDVGDPSTYTEQDGGDYIVCRDCGTYDKF